MRSLTSLCLACGFVAAATVCAEQPLLEPGDRVAFLGGTFVERMQSSGAVEAELQLRRPDWRLSFRNLGWSGDDVHGIARKRFDGPEDGFQRLLRDVTTAEATVVLVAYGYSEASDGSVAVERFEPGLRRLIAELASGQRRVILLTPVAMPGVRTPGYDQSISRCRQIIIRVGEETGVPVLSLDWRPEKGELTANRLNPSQRGYARLAQLVADRLVGGQRGAGQLGGGDRGGGDRGDRDRAELRRLIVDKNQLFFHRYRPQNETYLFLFRKHEQGNNSVEIPQFDPLIQAADRAIWRAAKLGS